MLQLHGRANREHIFIENIVPAPLARQADAVAIKQASFLDW
jgi:hypothetical protein